MSHTPAKWDQTPITPDHHYLLIIPGDEETWCRCTCGWTIPGHYPAPPDRNLESTWDAWYWPHAIQEEIKAERNHS